MKYICKTNEPEVLIRFKARAANDRELSYSKLGQEGEMKKEFHNHLILEQGYLCCYCGVAIDRSNSHVEHFKPQKKYPSSTLDYFNMLASCQKNLEAKAPIHCGMGKSDWFDKSLLVSPLIPNCVDFFEYTIDGQILPAQVGDKTVAATETIEKLRLNIPKLQAGRTGVIDSFYDEPDFLSTLSDDEIDKLIHYYSHTDEKGQHQPYCQVIIYLLTQEKMYRRS